MLLGKNPQPQSVQCSASAKTSNGKSLNDRIMVGSKQQPDLIELLIRLRFHPVVLSGDVTKMYRHLILNDLEKFAPVILEIRS